MTAAVYNLVIDQGSDFAIDLTIKEFGSAKDLSGYAARAQMRSTRTASSVAASFVCAVQDPVANGVVKMSLPNGVSSAIAPGRYFYDLEIHTTNNAVVRRLI